MRLRDKDTAIITIMTQKLPVLNVCICNTPEMYLYHQLWILIGVYHVVFFADILNFFSPFVSS